MVAWPDHFTIASSGPDTMPIRIIYTSALKLMNIYIKRVCI